MFTEKLVCILLVMITDTVSKAVLTSATADLNGPVNTTEAQLQLPEFTDPVLVVGGGLAGLSAALEAIHEGASVVLIDGEKDVGGNSQKASSGVAACNTEAQRVQNIKDSPELFYSDTMNAGDSENNPELVDLLVRSSANAIQFLIDHGVNLVDVNLCGGHSVKRVHWIPQPETGRPIAVGFGIIKALKEKIQQHSKDNPDKVRILTNTEVVGLVTWNDFVTGVRIRNDNRIDEIRGKAVILATGGFSNDRSNESSLLKEFAPDKMSFPTTNGPWASGRGVKMARAMGASLVGMNSVQIHPTSFIDPKEPAAYTKFLAAEALRGKGAILLNEKGERFADELGRRDYLTDRIQSFCAKNPAAGNAHVAYMLMSEKTANDFGRASFDFYAKIKGFFQKFDTLEELAKYMGVDSSKLNRTLSEYNAFVSPESNKKQDQFGKKIFPSRLDPQFFVAMITPAIHYTMGGVKIDRNAAVYSDVSGQPFHGLYAAGEVTGGVHGRNRLAGNSLLECTVYGRIAGRNAAQLIYSPSDATLLRQDL